MAVTFLRIAPEPEPTGTAANLTTPPVPCPLTTAENARRAMRNLRDFQKYSGPDLALSSEEQRKLWRSNADKIRAARRFSLRTPQPMDGDAA